MAISIIGYPADNISFCPRCASRNFEYSCGFQANGVLECECGCSVTIIANDNDEESEDE